MRGGGACEVLPRRKGGGGGGGAEKVLAMLKGGGGGTTSFGAIFTFYARTEGGGRGYKKFPLFKRGDAKGL